MIAAEATYKLTDLLGAAGATSGIIIAVGVFLQFLGSKYVDLSARFRQLTGEYRIGKVANERRSPLEAQIRMYSKRLRLVHWATWIGGFAFLLFLLAILCGGLNVSLPDHDAIVVYGTVAVFGGLGLLITAILLHILETFVARSEIDEELADLDSKTHQ